MINLIISLSLEFKTIGVSLTFTSKFMCVFLYFTFTQHNIRNVPEQLAGLARKHKSELYSGPGSNSGMQILKISLAQCVLLLDQSNNKLNR